MLITCKGFALVAMAKRVTLKRRHDDEKGERIYCDAADDEAER